MSAVMGMTPHLLEQAGVVSDGDQYTDNTALVLSLTSILVADRYRKDVGDVTDLKDSIENIGLLNPITVRPWHGGYRLVAGERRLTAFRELGLAEIPARVAHDIGDARDALVAERDENTARKPMLPSESAALGMAIEEMERPAAVERMAQGGRGGPGTTPSENWGYKTRDVAAEAIGMGEATYRRIKNLITTADNETESEEVREAAREAVEAIDQGAPVRTQYERVKESRRKSESVTAETAPRRANDNSQYLHLLAEMHPTMRIAFTRDGHEKYASIDSFGQAARLASVTWQYTERQWQAHIETSRDVLDRSSLGIEVALEAINIRVDMQTITPEQATEVLERLNASALNRIIKQLKEISNE